jgi:hypothetical protein
VEVARCLVWLFVRKAPEITPETLARMARQAAREEAHIAGAYAGRRPLPFRSILDQDVQMRMIEEVPVYLPRNVDRRTLDETVSQLVNESLDEISGNVSADSLKSKLREKAQSEAQSPSPRFSFDAYSGELSMPLGTSRGVIRAKINLYKVASKISKKVMCMRSSDSVDAADAYLRHTRRINSEQDRDACKRRG